MTTIGEAYVVVRPDMSQFTTETSAGTSKAIERVRGNLRGSLSGIESDFGRSGSRAGDEFGGEFYRDANGRIRDAKGKFVKDNDLPEAFRSKGKDSGDSFAKGLEGSGISGAVSRIRNQLLGLAAGAGLIDLGKTAVGVAANFEQVKIAFEGVLGSADKANAFIGKLQKFAAATPFEFPQLAKASQQLLGVGFSADQVIPVLTDLGNTAATLGVGADGINLVVRALGQIKGKGKVSAEELQQISENMPGFSAIAAIAAKRGTTVAQAFQDVSNGAVSADEGITAILDGMRKFPGAANAMNRQSQTLNGVISTLKDNLRLVAIDFITPHLPAMTKAVQTIGNLVANLFSGKLKDAAVDLGNLFGQNEDSGLTASFLRIADAVQRMAPTVKTVLVVGFSAAAAAAVVLTDALSYLLSGIASVTEAVTNQGEFLKEHGVAATLAADAVALLTAAFVGLKVANAAAGAVNSTADAIGRIPGAVKSSTDNIKTLADKLSDLKSRLSGLEDKVVKVAVDYQENRAKQAGETAGKGFVSGIAGAIGGAIAGVIVSGISGSAILSALGGVAATIAGAIFSLPVLIAAAVAAVAVIAYHFRKGIVHFFSDTLPEALKDGFGVLERFFTETIPRAASGFGSMLIDKGKELIDGLWKGIQNAWDAGVRFFTTLPERIAEFLGRLTGYAYLGGKFLIENLWKGVSAAWSAGVSFFTELPGKIGGFFSNAWSWLYEHGSKLISGLWSGIQVGWDAGITFFTELPGKVGGFFADAWRWLYEHGKALIQGLWDGIQAVWHDPEHFFIELPQTILARIGNVLRSLFQKGADLIQGLWDGAKDIFGKVVEWLKALPGNIVSAVGNLLETLKQAGKDLIQGLLNGIEELFGKVTDKAKSIGGAFLKGFRDVVDEHSPSREMHKSGLNLIRGLLNGIDAMRPDLQRMVDQVAGDVMGADLNLGSVMTNGSRFGSNGLATSAAGNVRNYNLTYQGVQSQADIAEQFRRMERLALPL